MSDTKKPMRLRYMELPSEVVGDDVTTPFLLIIDRCTGAQAERLRAEWAMPPRWLGSAVEDSDESAPDWVLATTLRAAPDPVTWHSQTGARAILVFADEVELS